MMSRRSTTFILCALLSGFVAVGGIARSVTTLPQGVRTATIVADSEWGDSATHQTAVVN